MENLILKGVNSAEDLDVAPDLKSVVIAGQNGEITIRNLSGKDSRKFKIKNSSPRPFDKTDTTPYVWAGNVRTPRWSPDGQQITYVLDPKYIPGGNSQNGSELRVINADGTGDHHIAGTTGGGLTAFNPIWSRDGRRLLFRYYKGDTSMSPDIKSEQLTALVDGSDIRPFDGKITNFNALEVSRNGKKWLQFDEERGVRILRIYSPSTTPAQPSPLWRDIAYQYAGVGLGRATFSLDGEQVIFEGSLSPAFLDGHRNLVYPGNSLKNPNSVYGLFMTTTRFPQLFVRDATLVEWL